MNATLPVRFCFWGAGGHGKVVLDAALAAAPGCAVWFVDDDSGRCGGFFCGFPVLPFSHRSVAGSEFVICIGDNHRRAQCYESAGVLASPAIVIHPSAVVSPSARIGPGTVVLARAVVNAGAFIGADSIVNTGAIIEHDCMVGDHSHISPGAILGGGACIGAFAHVGLGARVLPHIHIGDDTVVGAGSVVIRDVAARLVVAGVPSRVLRSAVLSPRESATPVVRL
jgi:sugar O-acyltransferase (sialic acid O-acetyltransferase NeuD family)